jgi:hypothetical protein
VDDDAVALKQIEHELLFRARRRHAHDRRPPAVGSQHRHGGRGRRETAQRGVVGADPIEDRRADAGTPVEQPARRRLHRRRNRQVGVGDELEAIERFGHEVRRAVERDPSELHLWEPGGLRQAPEPRRQAGRLPQRGGLVDRRAQRIVPEDFVDDERGAARGAAIRQLGRVASGQRGSRRIVRADGQHRACVRRPRPIQRVDVDRPRAVIVQRVAPLGDAVEPDEVFEERVARDRRQHGGRAGVAEQLEEDGIRFTRACREHDPFPIDRQAAADVGAGDGGAGVLEAERLRAVRQRRGIRERVENAGGIRQSDARRVRRREVDQRPPGALSRERPREACRRTIVRHARREHPY